MPPFRHLWLFQHCLAHRSHYSSEDQPLFKKANLRLGRMDIDINQRRIERNIDDGNRVPSTEQQRVIGFLHSITEHTTEYPAPIYKEREVLSRAFIASGLTDIT